LDIAGYISSGVLELYATGHLSASEEAEVESLARQYPEIRAELAAITRALDQYAALHAQTPPVALKAKVLTFVKTASADKGGRPETGALEPEARVVPLVPGGQRAASQAFKWLVAAALFLLLVSNALSIYFYRNWKKAEERLDVAEASQQQYVQTIKGVQEQLNHKEKVLALVGDPETRKVELKGLAKSPDSRVMVYWHQPSNSVYLAVNNLPAPPPGRQYQLWALVDGKPQDAGLLDTGVAFVSHQQMKDVSKAQAFAITLEPKGGRLAPTLDQMYVMGNI
jgi:hypothetical protein